MIHDEEDINFSKLTDLQFEEVCFELLMRLGYKALVWRQGGADSGRDVEGQLAVNNPLVGTFDEKWFFECKRHGAGVPPEQLNSKIAWADAEKPKHLVFFITSYLSNNARTWLEKISTDKSYSIHVIEGKQLKQLLLGFPGIVAKYFMDEYTKLLVEARKTWLVHDILPDLETLSLLSANLNPAKLSTSELGFLWSAGKIKACEAGVDEWVEEHGPFWLDPFFYYLVQVANSSEALLSEESDSSSITWAQGVSDWEVTYPHYVAARLLVNTSSKPRLALYSCVHDDEGEGIEVLIEATSDFPTKVRHIETGADNEILQTLHILASKHQSRQT